LDGAHALTGEGRHLRLRLDAPHARPSLDERLRRPTRAAADVDDAPPREVTLADEQLEDLLPVGVGGPQLVVAARDPPEVRTAWRHVDCVAAAKPPRLRRRSPPAPSEPRSRAAPPRATPPAPSPSAERPRSRAARGRPRPRARTRPPPSAGSSAAPPPRSRRPPWPPEPSPSFLCLLAGRHGFPLAPPRECAALLQQRPTALGEADVDRIEVLGHDCAREDGPGLACDLASEVAVREVRQREKLDLGGARDPGGFKCRRVLGLPRAFPLVLAEGRLVDEHIGPPRGLDHRLRRTAVARDHDFAPRASG